MQQPPDAMLIDDLQIQLAIMLTEHVLKHRNRPSEHVLRIGCGPHQSLASYHLHLAETEKLSQRPPELVLGEPCTS